MAILILGSMEIFFLVFLHLSGNLDTELFFAFWAFVNISFLILNIFKVSVDLGNISGNMSPTSQSSNYANLVGSYLKVLFKSSDSTNNYKNSSSANWQYLILFIINAIIYTVVYFIMYVI
jgi:hypothetical protein